SADSPERQALPGCNYTCGNVKKIPYPFGIGNSTTQGHAPCYLDSKFALTCSEDYKLVRADHFPVMFNITDFSISSKENMFMTVGCDSYGYLDSTYDGCCQVDIPPRMRNITVKASSFNTSLELPSINCTYSFVVKKD
ncbi:wall-associated receptor kinase 2-like, partial [Trifolium medium]|nr:wall-associated receptor kinase 2-like [Trifolium medium]